MSNEIGPRRIADLNWEETIPTQVGALLDVQSANLAVHGYGETSRRSSRGTRTRAKADEGARLEIDSGRAHRVIPKHLFAHSIQRLAAVKCSSM
jgi:hypothetical protein